MIGAVLDANVLASGFLGVHQPESIPGELLRLWRAGRFELIVSDHIRTEVINTLRDPYFRRRLSAAQQSRAAALLRYQARQVAVTAKVAGVATHQEDDLVLAAGMSARAQYLVTGDRKLQAVGSYEGVRIVPPREFIRLLEQEHGDMGEAR